MLSPGQLRTLALLSQGAATRHYYRERSGEYTWVHPAAPKPITPTLHRLFVKGLATVCEMDKNRAVITPRGQQVLRRAAWSGSQAKAPFPRSGREAKRGDASRRVIGCYETMLKFYRRRDR